MKDWEVRRVNELYKQIDQLKAENQRLEQVVEMSSIGERLDVIEQKLDQLLDGKTSAKTKRATGK